MAAARLEPRNQIGIPVLLPGGDGQIICSRVDKSARLRQLRSILSEARRLDCFAFEGVLYKGCCSAGAKEAVFVLGTWRPCHVRGHQRLRVLFDGFGGLPPQYFSDASCLRAGR